MGKAHGVPLPAPLAALRAASPGSARRLLLCLLAGCLAAPAALLLARRAGPARGAPGGSPLAAGLEGRNGAVVVGGIDQHGDVGVVLRGRADERRAPDVDLLDGVLK